MSNWNYLFDSTFACCRYRFLLTNEERIVADSSFYTLKRTGFQSYHNKTDCADAEELAATLACIHGQRPEMPVIQTAFGAVDASILDTLARARQISTDDLALTADLTLRRISVRIAPSITPYELQKFIEMFAENTFRVKGFIGTTQGVFLADCVGNVVSLQPCGDYLVPPDHIGWLNVLSGAAMPVHKAVLDACRWYSGQILAVETHGA